MLSKITKVSYLLLISLSLGTIGCSDNAVQFSPSEKGKFNDGPIDVVEPVPRQPDPILDPIPVPLPMPIPDDPDLEPQPDPIPVPLPMPIPDDPDPTPQPEPVPAPQPDPIPVPLPMPIPDDPGPAPQPDPDQAASEEFEQKVSRSNKLDVLIVADSSTTMHSNRFDLYRKLGSFKRDLTDADWQIGITSNDVGGRYRTNGKLVSPGGYGPSVLRADTSNLDYFFDEGISMSQCSDYESLDYLNAPCMVGHQERSFEAVTRAVDHPANQLLFRDESDVAVVIISNEDEMNGEVHPEALSPNDVVASFNDRWGVEKSVRVYGIIVEPEDSSCLAKQSQPFADPGARYGSKISQLANMTGGSTQSICDRSYSSLLQKMTEDVVKGNLENVFALAHTPKLGTVTVQLTPQQNLNWNVVGNKVVFDSAPQLGTKISVHYKY